MQKVQSARLPSQLVPAVGYARRSTDKQEASIPDQVKAVQRYADDNGYKILRWYTDDAISGDDTKRRLDFHRMLADAKNKGDFQAIIVWDQDRFGRFSPHEASYWTWPLSEAGIQLVTVVKGPIDWTDFTEWLMYSVNQHGKHQYLQDLSRNVARGQLEAANNGSWLGSAPYAYRIEGPTKHKRLVLDDDAKVRVVQRIFREFVEDGRALSNIADRLNAEGYLSPGGRAKGWRFDTVKVILENPAYTGDYAGCRWSYGKYHRIKDGKVCKSDGRTRNPEAEWVVRQDHHPAIIDRLMFQKAQAILAKGKTGRSKYTPENNPYMLSCLLQCGRCGCALYGMTKQGRRYYECGNRHYNGNDACLGTTVREDAILLSIADHLNQEFLSLDGDALSRQADRKELQPGDLPEAFAKIKAVVAPDNQPKGDRQLLEKQAKTLGEQIDLARRNLALLDPENIPAVEAEIRRLKAERDQLELELRKRPPTEREVNAETLGLLRTLAWMELDFRLAGENAEYFRTKGATYCFATSSKTLLRSVAGITVHTRIDGRGNGIRHAFERGEICFRPVRGNTGNLDPHLTG